MGLAKALGRCLDAAVIAGIAALAQMVKGRRFSCEQCEHNFMRCDTKQIGNVNRGRQVP
jgi:hypothetical protein